MTLIHAATLSFALLGFAGFALFVHAIWPPLIWGWTGISALYLAWILSRLTRRKIDRRSG